MATVLVTIPVYQINSSRKLAAPLYMAFPGSGLVAQPVAPPNNAVNGALIYSQVNSSATGATNFYSTLTVAQIITLANT